MLKHISRLVSASRRASAQRRARLAERKRRTPRRLNCESLEMRALMSAAPLSQWASNVVAFSSQYSASANSAAQALGAPNTASLGGYSTAWAPSHRDGTTETLTLGYTTPVYASGVTVRESCGNGFVTKVEVRNKTTGAFETVWTGTDTSSRTALADFQATFAQRSYLVDAVRLTINTSASTNWEEVDAVQLTGASTTGGSTTVALQNGANGYNGMIDTRINKAYPTSGYGSAATLYASNQSSSLLKWNLSTIPGDATVQSAKLTLNVTDKSAASYELYAAKKNWSESSANWNNAAMGTAWEVAGAKGSSDRDSTVLGTATATANGSYTITLNAAGVAAVQAWIKNPSANFGFILQDYTGTDSLAFSSSESSTASLHPKLEITYTAGSGGGTTQNAAPVVNAGADQSVTVGATATLNGTVSDDGLPNPPGAVTSSWTKVSGPGTVTFADSKAIDTTASFSAAGSYVLRLSANDGAASAADDVTVTVDSSTPVSNTSGIWISKDEIMSLPMTGTGWTTLVQGASQPVGTVSLANPDSQADTITLAKALVGTRTGNQTMINDARKGIMAAIGTEAGGESIGIARNLNSFVIAADIVGLDATQTSQFKAWLVKATRQEVYTDGRTMVQMHEERPNNWGLMAGASRATVALYLGDKTELARTAQVFKGWMGDRSSYANFKYGDTSWQLNPSSSSTWVGILPKGAVKDGHNVDGFLPEEMRRGDSYDPNTWPPYWTGYCWEALQGAFATANVLHRAGYDVYNWQDKALLRAVQGLDRLTALDSDWKPVGDDAWITFVINKAYGTNYAEDPAVTNDWYRSQGKVMAWTAWTHQKGGATVAVQPLSAAALAAAPTDAQPLEDSAAPTAAPHSLPLKAAAADKVFSGLPHKPTSLESIANDAAKKTGPAADSAEEDLIGTPLSDRLLNTLALARN